MLDMITTEQMQRAQRCTYPSDGGTRVDLSYVSRDEREIDDIRSIMNNCGVSMRARFVVCSKPGARIVLLESEEQRRIFTHPSLPWSVGIKVTWCVVSAKQITTAEVLNRLNRERLWQFACEMVT